MDGVGSGAQGRSVTPRPCVVEFDHSPKVRCHQPRRPSSPFSGLSASLTDTAWPPTAISPSALPEAAVFALLAGFFGFAAALLRAGLALRSEEHTSELQSLMRNSYAVSCLQKKIRNPIDVYFFIT